MSRCEGGNSAVRRTASSSDPGGVGRPAPFRKGCSRSPLPPPPGLSGSVLLLFKPRPSAGPRVGAAGAAVLFLRRGVGVISSLIGRSSLGAVVFDLARPGFRSCASEPAPFPSAPKTAAERRRVAFRARVEPVKPVNASFESVAAMTVAAPR